MTETETNFDLKAFAAELTPLIRRAAFAEAGNLVLNNKDKDYLQLAIMFAQKASE